MNRKEFDAFVNHWGHTIVVSGLAGVVITLAVIVFFIELWTNWRIIKRMGYPGPWSLFLWVPYVSFLFWAGIAFWRWPNQRK